MIINIADIADKTDKNTDYIYLKGGSGTDGGFRKIEVATKKWWFWHPNSDKHEWMQHSFTWDFTNSPTNSLFKQIDYDPLEKFLNDRKNDHPLSISENTELVEFCQNRAKDFEPTDDFDMVIALNSSIRPRREEIMHFLMKSFGLSAVESYSCIRDCCKHKSIKPYCDLAVEKSGLNREFVTGIFQGIESAARNSICQTWVDYQLKNRAPVGV